MAIPVAFRTQAEYGTGVDSASISTSLNIDVVENNNRIVIIQVAQNLTAQQNFSSVTVNGVAATLLERDEIGTVGSCSTLNEVWFILDADLPATTGTYSVVGTLPALAGHLLIQASLFTGIKQQTAEAVGISTSTTAVGMPYNVGFTSVTNNAMGYGAAITSCAEGILDQVLSPFTKITNFTAGSTLQCNGYDLDMGVAGSKTFGVTGEGGGYFRVIVASFEIDTAEPGSGEQPVAMMMGCNF